MDSSSVPSSTKFGKAGVPGASYSPPGTCREKRRELVADIPWLAPAMAEKDHTFVVPIEAFLSESMRRDVMSGTNIVVTLKMKNMKHGFHDKEKNLHPRSDRE